MYKSARYNLNMLVFSSLKNSIIKNSKHINFNRVTLDFRNTDMAKWASTLFRNWVTKPDPLKYTCNLELIRTSSKLCLISFGFVTSKVTRNNHVYIKADCLLIKYLLLAPKGVVTFHDFSLSASPVIAVDKSNPLQVWFYWCIVFKPVWMFSPHTVVWCYSVGFHEFCMLF